MGKPVVCLVRLIRLWTNNFRLFLSQQTVNGLRKKRLYFFFPFETAVYIYTVCICISLCVCVCVCICVYVCGGVCVCVYIYVYVYVYIYIYNVCIVLFCFYIYIWKTAGGIYYVLHGGGGRLRKQTYLADIGRESYKKDKIYSYSLACTTIF